MRSLASFVMGTMLSTASMSTAPVTPLIRVTPHVLNEGDTIRIRCQVPRHPDNRKLQIAIEGYRYTEVPIEGERGPVTTEITYQHVPCGVDTVSCAVVTSMGYSQRVTAPILVACRG
jgi:hypothetical protein